MVRDTFISIQSHGISALKLLFPHFIAAADDYMAFDDKTSFCLTFLLSSHVGVPYLRVPCNASFDMNMLKLIKPWPISHVSWLKMTDISGAISVPIIRI
jgi:hypothetical protein